MDLFLLRNPAFSLSSQADLFEKKKNLDDKSNIFCSQRKCKKGEDVNMVAIIIDKHINDFTPIQRIKAIQNLSAYLDIPIVSKYLTFSTPLYVYSLDGISVVLS